MGFTFGIDWASPGYFAYGPDWWFSFSCGRGDFASHLSLTLLGLSIHSHVYGPAD